MQPARRLSRLPLPIERAAALALACLALPGCITLDRTDEVRLSRSASLGTRAPLELGTEATDAPPAPVVFEVVDGVALAIHGGAGTILRERMTPELEFAYRRALEDALLRGHRVLIRGGSSLDAIEAALHPLEDSPLFNAGRGAVLNAEGEVEMDASIMSGQSGLAGAVAGARTVRHAISAARAVMDSSEHVMFSGEGADRFIESEGLEQMQPEWFVVPHRKEQMLMKKALREDKTASLRPASRYASPHAEKFGTVGCVALDEEGHLAAGTSTGGMVLKAWGRIGDSPIIGAGTWADDRTCAVSCTGWGEFFIRRAIAHQMHARMLFGGTGLVAAAQGAVMEDLPRGGGSGGAVALDSAGRMVAPFTTPGMYRGWVTKDGRVTVRIHGDEREPVGAAGGQTAP